MIPALALFVLSIIFVVEDPNAAYVAAGIGGVVASLGITWKVVGASLGKTAANLERPVCEAALDAQICDAMTLTPNSKIVRNYTPPQPAGEHRWTEGTKFQQQHKRA